MVHATSSNILSRYLPGILIILGLFIPLPGHTMPTSTGNSNHSSALSQTFDFKGPQIIIDGIPVPAGIMDASLKFACIEASVFHGAINFNSYAPRVSPDITEALIGRELLVREAAQAGMQVEENTFQDHLNDRVGSFGGQGKFNQILHNYDLTYDDYTALVRHAFKARTYVEKHLRPSLVTEDDVRRYYNENIVKFTTEEKRFTDFIVLNYVNDTPPAGAIEHLMEEIPKINGRDGMMRVEARHKAKFLNQVRTGGKYFDIQYDIQNGGVYWAEGFGKLKEGQAVYLNPKAEKKNHYIYLLRKIEPEVIKPYTEAREKIRSRLEEQRASTYIIDAVENLKKQHEIKIIDPR